MSTTSFCRVRSDVTRQESDALVAERVLKQRALAASLDEQIRSRGQAASAETHRRPLRARAHVDGAEAVECHWASAPVPVASIVPMVTPPAVPAVATTTRPQGGGDDSSSPWHAASQGDDGWRGRARRDSAVSHLFARATQGDADGGAYGGDYSPPLWQESPRAALFAPPMRSAASSPQPSGGRDVPPLGHGVRDASRPRHTAAAPRSDGDVVVVRTGGAVRARPRSHVVAFGGSEAGRSTAAERRARGDAAAARDAEARRARAGRSGVGDVPPVTEVRLRLHTMSSAPHEAEGAVDTSRRVAVRQPASARQPSAQPDGGANEGAVAHVGSAALPAARTQRCALRPHDQQVRDAGGRSDQLTVPAAASGADAGSGQLPGRSVFVPCA